MPIRHGDSFEKNGSICLRCSFFTSTVAPFSSTPCAWKTLFARSSPIVAILIVNAPLSVRVSDSQHSGCGPVQGRPHHQALCWDWRAANHFQTHIDGFTRAAGFGGFAGGGFSQSDEHTSELQSLMCTSYAVFRL